MKSSNKLVVGLDYGTTYTGVSFCEKTSRSPGMFAPEIIHDWPAVHTKVGTKEKVPSEITFEDGTITWGSQIAPNKSRHMWTKLRLDDNHAGQAANVTSEISASSGDAPKSPVEIIAAYLSKVRQHLMKNLEQKYGEKLLKTLPITLVVTVPPVWSDIAKARTLQAVHQAGFNSVQLPQLEHTIMATEPECAAIYTITTLRNTVHDANFKVGDAFTICDMGGGTVDLISYIVVSLDPLRVKEATVGTGDQCGGTFVDRAFLELLEHRLGTEDFIKIAGCPSSALPHTSLAPKADKMLRDFCLDAKGGFSGEETNFIHLPNPLSKLEDDGSRKIIDGEIRLDPEDMESLFDRSLRCTYELLGKQLKAMRESGQATIKYIFLVGGFAESPYVFKKIKNFAETSFGVTVLRPSHSWSAIARGAATKGMEGDDATVTLRKCRRHYGTAYAARFRASKHDTKNAFIDTYTGLKYANNQMSWLLKEGQDLPVKNSAHAVLELGENLWPDKDRNITIDLYACNKATAPQLSDDDNVFIVATLQVDLSVVPKHEFRPMRSPVNGKKNLRLDFTVEISIQSTIEYSLVVGGVKYGSVIAEYK